MGCGFSGWLDPPWSPVFRITKLLLIGFTTASRFCKIDHGKYEQERRNLGGRAL